MFRSASLLAQAASVEPSQHRNACYLAGYVVECVLKAMITARYTKARVVDVPSLFSHELSDLEALLTAQAVAAERDVVRYGLPVHAAPTMCTIVGQRQLRRQRIDEAHWHPFHRYDGSRWVTSSTYIAEAKAALDILTQLQLDGVI